MNFTAVLDYLVALDLTVALSYLGVYVGMVALDFVWAFYTLALTKHQSVRAAGWASMLIVITGFVTVNYVENHMLLIAASLGAFTGTLSASKILKGQEPDAPKVPVAKAKSKSRRARSANAKRNAD